MSMDTAEQEKLLKEMHSDFRELKETAKANEVAIKASGTTSGELQLKLEKLNTSLDTNEKALEKLISGMNDRDAKQTLFEAKLDEMREDFKKQGFKDPFPGGTNEAQEKAKLAKEALFKAVKYNAKTATKTLQEYMGEVHIKALVQSNNEAGGYLCPPEWTGELIVGIVEWSPVRAVCRVRTTSNESVKLLKRKTTAAASWVGETGNRTETQNPTFGMETIPVHELYAFVPVSLAEMEDSVFDLEQFLKDEFAEQFGVSEGAAFVNGNGVNKPFGFAVNGDIASIGSGDSLTITSKQLIALSYEPKEAYITNGTWALNRSTLRGIRQMTDGNGNFIWAPGIAKEARPNTILDRPYVICPDLASPTSSDTFTFTAASKPIFFGDFRRAVTIVDRLDISMMNDPFSSKQQGMLEISARKRVGAQVVLAEALKSISINA